AKIPFPASFIKRFNQLWLEARERQSKFTLEQISAEKHMSEPVFFKSTQPIYNSFPNFFPSLIFMKYKTMEPLSKVYYSSETAYVTASLATYASQECFFEVFGQALVNH
ncbi:MAG: hypothetical protein ACI8RA_002628, partial [Chlamydiales bacterium]